MVDKRTLKSSKLKGAQIFKKFTAAGRKRKRSTPYRKSPGTSTFSRYGHRTDNSGGTRTNSGTAIERGRKSLRNKKAIRTLADWDVATVGYTNLKHPSGVQGVTNILTSASVRDILVGNATSGTSPDVFSYFQLNPNQITTGSGLVGNQNPRVGLLATNPNNDRILLKTIEFNFKLTNMESIETTISLYCYTWKDNSQYEMAPQWARVCDSIANGQLTQTVPAPGVYATGARQGNADPTQWGQKPMALRDMRRHFRVLKVFKYALAAASTQEVFYKVTLNKVLSRQYFNSMDTNTNFAKGVSIGWMAICHSQPVIDKTVLNGHVGTLGPAEIACVWRTKSCLASLKNSTQRVDVNRQYTQIPFNAGFENLWEMNNEDQAATVKES